MCTPRDTRVEAKFKNVDAPRREAKIFDLFLMEINTDTLKNRVIIEYRGTPHA